MARMREQRCSTSSHHDSHTGTEVVLLCVLGGNDIMLMAGTGHNAVTGTVKDIPRCISFLKFPLRVFLQVIYFSISPMELSIEYCCWIFYYNWNKSDIANLIVLVFYENLSNLVTSATHMIVLYYIYIYECLIQRGMPSERRKNNAGIDLIPNLT